MAKKRLDFEELRNRGTTQMLVNRGLVVKAPARFKLFITSDWHCGALACSYGGLKRMLTRLGNTRGARMIIGGDQMEMCPPGHHEGLRDQDSDPDHQIIRTAEALMPYKRRISLIYSGNHGKPRFMKQSGFDPDLILAAMLGVPYSTVPTVVQYVSGKHRVRICGGHGKSGAQNGKIELHKMRLNYPECDLYHLGHNHMLFAERAGGMKYDSKGREHWDETWLCRSGSFLRYAEYARYAGYPPMPTGYLIADIRDGVIVDVEEVKE